jgi:hypothetical protein
MTLLLKGINFIKTSIKIIFITFFISLLADFFFGKLILKSLNSYFATTEFYGKIMRTDHPIFHHTIIPNVNYNKARGFQGLFTLCTNNHGFVSKCNQTVSKNFDIGIIGDSFVEGSAVNYEDSFVGIFDEKKKNTSVANLGVTSYSPKIYFSKLNYLINNNFKFKHIIFFIDISEFYDDNMTYTLNKDNTVGEYNAKEKGLKRRKFLRSNFPLTNFYMYVLKKNRQVKKNVTPTNNKIPIFNQKAEYKGQWTYYRKGSHVEYNISIIEGQNKMIETMNKTYELLKKNNIKMSLAVYPWPQQLKNDVVNSKHVKMWKKFCLNKCEQFIDYFPYFFEEKEKSSYLEVYKKYYWWNDIHFNKLGNKIIADKLIETF